VFEISSFTIRIKRISQVVNFREGVPVGKSEAVRITSYRTSWIKGCNSKQ
jgi:hypothetical protein